VNSRTITVYQVYYLSDWIAGGKERYVKELAPGVGFSPLGLLKAPLGGFEPTRPFDHRISNPTPYQVARPSHSVSWLPRQVQPVTDDFSHKIEFCSAPQAATLG